ncbi:MAG: NAD(P)/FAD-dependent oxidoreductase [Rickettsiales bacterium]|nr:NAD(P)/FAD-dependent oxidoreductase [Rickettsiales bacterium]
MYKSIVDVAIIGAGAAGLMCAIEAGKRGRKVVIIDSATKVGNKIIISGGGRCNFTNLNISAAHYLSQNEKFIISALSRYSNKDFIKLVESYKLSYHEKELGQLFCDGKSQQIVDMLLNECNQYQVCFALNTVVTEVRKEEDRYILTTNTGLKYKASSLVIACGGLSIPKLGASTFGYEIARKFGINIIRTEPGLVPLTVSDDLEKYKKLAGVSLNVAAKAANVSFHNGMLFTHRGVSGPAILQISSYLYRAPKLTINFIPNSILEDFLHLKTVLELRNYLSDILPKSFVNFIMQYLEEHKYLSFKKNDLSKLYALLTKYSFDYNGNEGYAKAEVTLGGVDTKCLSSKTFECNAVKSLYFIGEVVDVTGHLGGYNFQWAWSSGFSAGQYV